jgi:hypothetical protein
LAKVAYVVLMGTSEKFDKLRSLRPRKSKKGYLWVTLVLIAVSFAAHWTFAWFDYVSEQNAAGGIIDVNGYLSKTMSATMENWQSEFLQLMWQVARLSILWYVGSPQSKEEHNRLEEKIDYLLKKTDPQNAQQFLLESETRYPKK